MGIGGTPSWGKNIITHMIKSTDLFNNAGSDQRQHDFVMAGEVKSLASFGCWPLNDIG